MGAGSMPYGQLATDSAPSLWAVQFAPKYLCAIYITRELNPDKKIYELKARQAYAPYDSSASAGSLRDEASALLDSIKSSSYDKSIIRVDDNFDNFSFNSMQYLVFALDIPAEELDFCRGQENGVIQLSSLGAANIELIGETRQENFAFFNLKEITLNSTLANNEGYVMEYWNTTPDGRWIQADKDDIRTHYYYSMNIFLRQRLGKLPAPPVRPPVLPPWPNANAMTLPIILDPDVGNNGGEP